jgi:hypothetical protein
MNQNDFAFFTSLKILTLALARGNTDRPTLVANFRDSAKAEANSGQQTVADILELLARVAESDRPDL